MKYQKETEMLKNLQNRLQETIFHNYNREDLYKKIKDGYSLLTETDLTINKLVIDTIHKLFPDDQIISEESEMQQIDYHKRVWIIDPICGTGNFATGILFFTTNITLFENGKPVVSFVSDYPNRTYIWASEDQEGVFVGDKKVGNELILDRKTLVNVDYGYMPQKGSEKEIDNIAKIVGDLIKETYWVITPNSSLAFSYAALAKFGAFIVTYTYPWDNVAACYLMEKNGGIMTDFKGEPWHIDSKYLIGSLDKDLHKKLLRIIQKYWR